MRPDRCRLSSQIRSSDIMGSQAFQASQPSARGSRKRYTTWIQEWAADDPVPGGCSPRSTAAGLRKDEGRN
ncbi:hypothetical protein LZ554_006266 [Drepanopeziza brunnea f. sp. 'monogermtubi']|nr:hypothetical protein LZ554_006266 [Drepanopeziza brunnea f. sp. 'monogermtubi']